MTKAVVDPFRYRVAPEVVFSEHQLETLVSILDTYISPLSKEQEDALVIKLKDTHDEEEVRKFCQISSTSLASLDSIKNFIDRSILGEKRQELLMLLSVISTLQVLFQ
jgi:hypothetical protein